MPSKTQLNIIAALLLVIGFAAGALTVAILQPKIWTEKQFIHMPPAAQQAGQADKAQPMIEAEPQLVEAAPALETKHADTKDVPADLVAFIRERLEKNTESGTYQEINWTHHIGKQEVTRISVLALQVAAGGHAATLNFRSHNGGRWHTGWISAAQYAPDHFDWCGIFNNSIFQPVCTMPSEKPLWRSDIEKGFKMMDGVIDARNKAHPPPAPGFQVPQDR